MIGASPPEGAGSSTPDARRPLPGRGPSRAGHDPARHAAACPFPQRQQGFIRRVSPGVFKVTQAGAQAAGTTRREQGTGKSATPGTVTGVRAAIVQVT